MYIINYSFYRRDYMVGHKTYSNKFKELEIDPFGRYQVRGHTAAAVGPGATTRATSEATCEPLGFQCFHEEGVPRGITSGSL